MMKVFGKHVFVHTIMPGDMLYMPPNYIFCEQTLGIHQLIRSFFLISLSLTRGVVTPSLPTHPSFHQLAVPLARTASQCHHCS